jgi:DNA polymerase (family 10)
MGWVQTSEEGWTGAGGSARSADGVELHVSLAAPEDFGAALVYHTGSEGHTAELNELAEKLGLTPLGPGVSPVWTRERSERDIYAVLGLPFIIPELREGKQVPENLGQRGSGGMSGHPQANTGGEFPVYDLPSAVEAALAGQIPHLVDLDDIRGDLHVHSTWSDGSETVRAMAEASKELGYEYIAVCDHSVSSKIANGLSFKRVLSKMKEVKEINEMISEMEILMGTEVDILKDGSLDYPDEILGRLDVVTASVHSNFSMDEAAMTKRIISAIENRFVHIIGHLTGRILGRRDPYQVNIGAIVDAAAENNTSLEINAYPDRLDLKDTHARWAKERGVIATISTDAHNTADLGLMIYGVYTARRGWLERGDVLNALPLVELTKWLRNR